MITLKRISDGRNNGKNVSAGAPDKAIDLMVTGHKVFAMAHSQGIA